MSDKNMETKLPVNHGTTEEGFHLWETRLKAALCRRDLMEGLEARPVDKNVSEKALSKILLPLSDSPCSP